MDYVSKKQVDKSRLAVKPHVTRDGSFKFRFHATNRNGTGITEYANTMLQMCEISKAYGCWPIQHISICYQLLNGGSFAIHNHTKGRVRSTV